MALTTVELKEVFRLQFVAFKSVSYHMHFKNDINKTSARLRGSFGEVLKICTMMCNVASVAKCNKAKKLLDETANLFLDIAR